MNGPKDINGRLLHDGGLPDVLAESEPYDVRSANGAQLTRCRLTVVAVSEIESRELRWLWAGRIPLGKVTVLMGQPGNGKSMLTLDVAARVSVGLDMPDGGRAPSGSVLVLSAEDDPADTIRPRLEAAGANLARVHVVSVKDGWFSMAEDLGALEAEIARIGDVRLVIVDPLAAYLGVADSHRNAEMRALLGPLSEMASRTGVAVLVVAHLNKGSTSGPLDRLNGSIAVGAVARSVLLVGPDPGNADRRVLAPVKSNLAILAPGLAYRIEELDGKPRIAWEGSVGVRAEEVIEALHGERATRAARSTAKTWLREQLIAGPVPAAVLRDSAAAARHCWRTVERAAEDLGVERDRTGFPATSTWSLPEHDDGTEDVQSCQVGRLDASGATGREGSGARMGTRSLAQLEGDKSRGWDDPG